MEEALHNRPVGALVHAVRILRHLAALGRPEGVSAIARATGVNGSTCFNILRTLASEGLVVFDDHAKTYHLGFGLVDLSLGLLGASPSALIQPELNRLSRQYGALMSLWYLTEHDRWMLIDRAFEERSVRVDLPIGKRLPALIGAVGRLTAAHRALPVAELRTAYDALRWQSAPGFDTYCDEIAQAGRDGYAVDRGKLYLGVDAVAALVTDATGAPRYGVSSVSLAGQIPPETLARVGQDLAMTCDRLSRALFAPTTADAPPVSSRFVS